MFFQQWVTWKSNQWSWNVSMLGGTLRSLWIKSQSKTVYSVFFKWKVCLCVGDPLLGDIKVNFRLNLWQQCSSNFSKVQWTAPVSFCSWHSWNSWYSFFTCLPWAITRENMLDRHNTKHNFILVQRLWRANDGACVDAWRMYTSCMTLHLRRYRAHNRCQMR